MLNHVARLHKKWYEALLSGASVLEGSKQQTISDSISNQFDQKRFESLLIKFWIAQDLAFEAIDSLHFIEMIKMLNGRARLFKSDALKSKILQKFDELKQQRKLIIARVKNKINFTHDIWTARNGLSFLAITCHYLDHSWEYQSFLLDFIGMPGSHTGELICEKFIECVKNEYKIDEKRFGAIVADNATNNDMFVRLLGRRFGFQISKQIRCFPHVSNLGVQEGLEYIKPAIVTLRNGIKHTRVSQVLMTRLKELCDEDDELNNRSTDEKIFCKPIIDVQHRWDSTYMMLQSSLRLKQPLKV